MPEDTLAAESETKTAEVKATESAEAKPETKPEPDWHAAYVGLQTSMNRHYGTVDELRQQNAVILGELAAARSAQKALLKETVGEDRAKTFEEQETRERERALSVQAAKASEELAKAQATLYMDLLSEAGVDPKSIDWAPDSKTPAEWANRVGPNVKEALRKANEERIRKTADDLKAKSKKEIEEEAKVLAEKQIKDSGVDKIDTGKTGSSTSNSFRDKLRNATPEQLEQMRRSVAAGKQIY